jgi:putative spermidine/putrescine transport system ATP-binding protein
MALLNRYDPAQNERKRLRGAALEIVGLTKRYGSVTAVEGVDLRVAQGEFVTFLGPSGSGKTTTLMMVAGLQQPTSGQMFLDGTPLEPLPAHKRNIGVVFQQYALFPHMTVAQNVRFPLEMRRVPKHEADRRINEVLRLVDLATHHRRLPAQLSGGQQQRVALARAIVFEPSLLLMDEPLGALDRKLREQMQTEIARLHKELDMTVLYVTHDQSEALTLSHRIAVFNYGRINQIGTPAELYERPRTRFVAAFLGDSCFLPGKVTRVSSEVAEIETAHGLLRGRNSGALGPGAAALLAVRPERITLSRHASGKADNNLAGTLQQIVYLGQSRKLIVRLGDGTIVSTLAPITAEDEGGFDPGDHVELAWSSRGCNVLTDDGEAKDAE